MAITMIMCTQIKHQAATAEEKVEYCDPVKEEDEYEEDEDHIYESLPDHAVRLKSMEDRRMTSPTAPQVELGNVEVGDHLKGIVKDKVVEFETLARNSTLENNPSTAACHVNADPDVCPQSLKQSNSGARAPFRV